MANCYEILRISKEVRKPVFTNSQYLHLRNSLKAENSYRALRSFYNKCTKLADVHFKLHKSGFKAFILRDIV